MFACTCLNIIIEAEEGLQEAGSLPELGPEELQDSFFKANVRQVDRLKNINKTQPGLVQTRQVGSWIVHHCINCNVQTHALHQEKGASCVLVNANLLKLNEIKNLQKSEKVSKVFGIIIDSNKFISDDGRDPYIPAEVEGIIKSIKQTSYDVLRKETLEIEERIKKYTLEQYAILDELREKAFNEQRFLIKTVLAEVQKNAPKVSGDTQMTQIEPNKTPSKLKDVESVPPNLLSTSHPRHTPKRQRSSPGTQINSFDSEVLFDVEGIDDLEQSIHESDMEDSENDDDVIGRINGKVTPMGRPRSASVHMAKSLPMNIPIFLGQQKHETEDLDDTLPPEVNVDIADSIKKLAKSVHGNAVFGDLPKPRFSTQI